jgi:hypothetical protein
MKEFIQRVHTKSFKNKTHFEWMTEIGIVLRTIAIETLKIAVPYKLKKLGVIVAFGVAGFFMNGCDTNDDPQVLPHDTSYGFNAENFENIYPSTDKIKASADSVDVRTVYLVPEGEWGGYVPGNTSIMIDKAIKPALDVSLKVRLKGNFARLKATEADSLFLVVNGATVNQY